VAGTSTDPEAVAQLEAALRAWASTATGLVRQSAAATSAVVAQAEAAVRARIAKKTAIEAALRAAREDAERARLSRELRDATAALECAKRGLGKATGAARSAQVLERRIDESGSSRVPDATRSLARKLSALADYRAATLPTTISASPSGTPMADRDYGVTGIVDVPLEQATFDDNPIQDGYHKGGADAGDYRWAVETWETVVRPGVLAGKTRDDFEQRDLAMGRESGFRRTAGVYDMFLGSDPIQFSRRADGTLDVPSGRHRVQIAQQLGITHLPGRVHG